MTSGVSEGAVKPLVAGDSLGPFCIVRSIGKGGMAEVFLAERVGVGGFRRYVALKVLEQARAQDPAWRDMFLDEARLSASIEHPNVVSVEEIGEVRGHYYQAMPYVRGCSLAQLVRWLARLDRSLRPEVAVGLVMQAASGLHAAHEALDSDKRPLGIVHRDVSPQNILVDVSGHVRVIDFGVARARRRLHWTQTPGVVRGKLRYMAPEQLAAEAVDRRADVYALAVVLWELLTFEPWIAAFPAHGQGTARADKPPGVNEEIDAAVLTALSAHRDARYATARSFRNALALACPDAKGVDASEVGALVASVVGRERAKTLPGMAGIEPPQRDASGGLPLPSEGASLTKAGRVGCDTSWTENEESGDARGDAQQGVVGDAQPDVERDWLTQPTAGQDPRASLGRERGAAASARRGGANAAPRRPSGLSGTTVALGAAVGVLVGLVAGVAVTRMVTRGEVPEAGPVRVQIPDVAPPATERAQRGTTTASPNPSPSPISERRMESSTSVPVRAAGTERRISPPPRVRVVSPSVSTKRQTPELRAEPSRPPPARVAPAVPVSGGPSGSPSSVTGLEQTFR